MLSSVEKDASNTRIASLGYLIASYQYVFPKKGYEAGKIASWIQDLATKSDLDLTDVTDEEIHYVLRLFSVGGLWSRNPENSRKARIEDIHI